MCYHIIIMVAIADDNIYGYILRYETSADHFKDSMLLICGHTMSYKCQGLQKSWLYYLLCTMSHHDEIYVVLCHSQWGNTVSFTIEIVWLSGNYF